MTPIQLQVMWNRLISIVEEQALTLIRTAFSTSVREAGDLSAGVFDAEGRMLAQAVTGTPGHINAMAAAVGNFIAALGIETMAEGDVYLTNDPWLGTGHLHDFTFVTPSFRAGRLVGFFACTAHVVDVGGRGFGPDAQEVFEEGICIPIMRFATAKGVDKSLLNIIRINVRQPDQLIGDLYSLAACNDVGNRRLAEMMNEFDLADLTAVRDFIFENSRRATLEKFGALPAGTYTNQMTVDGFEEPVTYRVKLDVSPERIVADYDGTSPVSGHGVNVPLIYTKAYTCYGLKCALAPEIPNNHASLEPFEVTAPEGCILNAPRPCAVAVRHVMGQFLPDVVLGAIHQFAPDIAPAESFSALWNLQLSARPVRGARASSGERLQSAEMLMFNSGGTGARPTLDGLNATAFPSGVHSMSVEATEHTGPITVWRKELREGSGGAGRTRGGLGQIMEIAPNEGHEFWVNAMYDRVDHPAKGRAGGEAGAAGEVSLDDGTKLKAKGRQHVPEGRRLILALPGGGGFGDPTERDSDLAAQDVARGYITEKD